MSTSMICGVCESPFEGRNSRARYCGEECRRAARATRAAKHRQTPEYRAYYEDRLAAGKYAESNRRARARRRVVSTVECRYCKAEIEVAGAQVRVICRENPECTYHYNRDKTSLAIAKQRGVEIGEAFSYLDVLARDEWTCRICGEAIDPGLRHPDPGSATVDHVIPLAAGGPHSMENAQAAHFTCNCQKSDSWELAA